jgi:hypothetical protein
MNLADELHDLRTKRSEGRIGPVEYYEALARLVDDSPDAIPDPAEAFFACVRRIEALLEDRLGASGAGLDWKIESRADRIPPLLRAELRSIAASQAALASGYTLSPVEIGGLQIRCARALIDTLRLALTVSPPDPSIRIAAFLPPWATRGVVRTVRHSQRPIRAGWRYLEHYALTDIDGRLVVIASTSPFRIECGDWVAVAGNADYEVGLFRNQSRPSGSKREWHQRTAWVLAALGVLVTLAGGATVCLALSRAAHSHWHALLIARCAALALAGTLMSWIGLWFASMMRQAALLARAFEAVLGRSGNN